ncbi:hypothetical protein Mp_8g05700 [Marchantia polymorpha subsp. ruderalis]|uniref:Coenzyme Q-binding protein COQ10 START domain-containing protein n=1 Tax=Marchantia polymorpha TaxID=3197 RepID=A0A2R6WKI1_MARPO|nr:hypothetical protein MARPO_0081s0072 [Marchantia polymorpha]BBN18811.1 hypothetical protein Mp_8g05700 [Marchantia polymorpha subsp. ruderalis]|eukprot:PTQ34352.1 hypothetical protein MARPO_0081s0072 [Marchantia polymorpha]
MGEQNDAEKRDGGEAGEQQEKRPAFASNRRTGSSWNRGGNSSWNVGSKDQRRARRRAVSSSAGTQEGDSDSSNDSGAFSGSDGKKGGGVKPSLVSGEPQVHVQKGKEAFEVEGSVVTEAHPDALYNIITDYENSAKVYRTVDKVEVEEQGCEKVVTQHLHWSFLMWSGKYDVRMRMKPNPETRSISYNLDKQGFLKIFNGSWTVEPIAVEGKPTVSKLTVQQEVLPSFMPPGPLGAYTAKIMSGQVKNLLSDVAKEASEVTKSGASAA